jgi:hypothetical protein
MLKGIKHGEEGAFDELQGFGVTGLNVLAREQSEMGLER